MDFFLCFFMDIGRYLLRACGVIQTVIILTVQKKTWLQRSMVVQLPFLVAHNGWTTLSGSHVGNVFAVLLPEYFHLKLSERQPLP